MSKKSTYRCLNIIFSNLGVERQTLYSICKTTGINARTTKQALDELIYLGVARETSITVDKKRVRYYTCQSKKRIGSST